LKRYSILAITILLVLICALPCATNAQKKTTKRRPTKSTKSKAKPTPTPTPTPMPDMRPEAARVAVLIKNMTLFLYTYGKVVNGLELADEQARRNQIPPNIIAKNKESKDALVSNIAALRAGLSTLLKDFQGSSRFQVQYLKMTFATESVLSAERLVSAGRYDEAGKALIQTIDRLTDTMLSMRLQ
jgi:hypothetical protein